MKATLVLAILLGIALFGDTDAWSRRRRRRSDPAPSPINTPPSFYNCPQSLSHQYTPTSTKVVTWVEPTCSDTLSSCTISRSGPPSGSQFSEGYHVIGYTAYDTAGLSNSCQVTFTVVVVRCGSPGSPQHCTVTCSQSTSVGSVCLYECASGLTLTGSSQRVCQELSGNTAQWSGTLPGCTDDYAPTISQCPDPMTVDRTHAWGVEVTFTVPSATDNFDQSLDSWTNPTDLRSPYNFTADTTCEYHFRDDAGNAASCVFDVTLHDTVVPEFLSCPPSQTLRTSLEMTPVTWDEPTVRDIPDDEVRLTCNYGSNSVLLPWGANHVIYTATNMKNGLNSICDFFVTIEPMPCLSLRSPAHGALSCDRWAYGRYCSMSCNDNYDIPVPSPFQPATDVYTCGSSGQWSPHSYIPDCSQIRDPTKSNLPTELLYYSGQCPSPDIVNSIAQSFIETINKSVHKDICQMNDECTVNNVAVLCGWPARRRKRALVVGRRKRDTTAFMNAKPHAVLEELIEGVPGDGLQRMQISMDLGINITYPNVTRNAQEKLANLAKTILDIFVSEDKEVFGFLDRLDRSDADSYLLLGDHVIECPEGSVADSANRNCVACTTGHFYDAVAKVCSMCGYGLYQDGYAQTECKQCPTGQSTAGKGSRSQASCIDQCEKGYFSTSGLSPCIQCPLNTFQPLIGQSQCFECPDGKKTWNRGATDNGQCKEL